MPLARRTLLAMAAAPLLPDFARAQNVGVKADTAPVRSESGVGALMPWADLLWAVTYVSHGSRTGSGTGLYEIDENLKIRQRHASNGTYANRLVHPQSNQVIIGPYVIDEEGGIRIIQSLVDQRLAATMTHLAEPANKVYMLTMEGLFYEMDIHTAKTRLLYDLVKEFHIRKQPHFKGGFSGGGRVIVANNTYTAWGEREGQLAEWDGNAWTVLEHKPFLEVAGRGSLGGAIFATGWDEASALLMVRFDGQWHRYRLPKASHTFDQFWQTEWTRIREVETERYLMDCHGMFYELSPMIFEKSVWGVRPIATHLRVVPDFCTFRGMLVLGGNEGTENTFLVSGQPQSGIWFGKTDDLWRFGKPQGWGGPWRFTAVRAGEPSDPFLMTGFDKKVLHLHQTGGAGVTFRVEVDFLGTGFWQPYERIVVPSGEYRYHLFPEGFSAHWVRLTPDADCKATAEFMYT